LTRISRLSAKLEGIALNERKRKKTRNEETKKGVLHQLSVQRTSRDAVRENPLQGPTKPTGPPGRPHRTDPVDPHGRWGMCVHTRTLVHTTGTNSSFSFLRWVVGPPARLPSSLFLSTAATLYHRGTEEERLPQTGSFVRYTVACAWDTTRNAIAPCDHRYSPRSTSTTFPRGTLAKTISNRDRFNNLSYTPLSPLSLSFSLMVTWRLWINAPPIWTREPPLNPRTRVLDARNESEYEYSSLLLSSTFHRGLHNREERENKCGNKSKTVPLRFSFCPCYLCAWSLFAPPLFPLRFAAIDCD